MAAIGAAERWTADIFSVDRNFPQQLSRRGAIDLTVSEFKTLAFPLLIGAAAFAVNYVFAFFLMKVTKIPKGRRGIFVNTIVNANTIFIGMPLNEVLFGEAAIKYFLVYYVLNTISTWTIGLRDRKSVV